MNEQEVFSLNYYDAKESSEHQNASKYPKKWKNYTNIYSIWNPNQSEWRIIFWKVTLIQSTLGKSLFITWVEERGWGDILGGNTWCSEGTGRR